MNFPHVHLLLNHFPIIGTIVGLGLLLASLWGKNQDLRRPSLIIFVSMALISLLAFFSGTGAQGAIKKLPGVSEALIERHQGAAMLAMIFMEIAGALSLVELWNSQGKSESGRRSWSLPAIVIFSIVTAGLMARVGTTGGDIRHSEIGTSQAELSDATPLAKTVHRFEPSPQRVAELMTASKWWWAFMMDVHFIGLVLLIGTVGLADLRLLGFAKQIPFASLYRLLPWGLVGFGLNLITGVLAFTGMDQFYTYDWAFWLKMFAIMLLGLNAAFFYFTPAFDSVASLGPGQDAPPFVKLIAATSLFLWISVITLGRYIQLFSDTVSVHK
jgi:uncharacterized membrane protein